MSKVILKRLEIENFGRFYNPATLVMDGRISAVVLWSSGGKSTFVKALEWLSKIVLEGDVKDFNLNFCNIYPEKPKGFVKAEVLLEICDSSHHGLYRYGIRVTRIGVLEEYLIKERSQRRIFYRYKNDLDLDSLSVDEAQYVKANISAQKPILHLVGGLGLGIYPYLMHFFERLWIIRVGSINSRLSASHLFKKGFFTRRSNVKNCCDFLRMFDTSVCDITRVQGTGRISVIHRSANGYDYPVRLSEESDSFIKCLSLYRAVDALKTYGGLIIMDVGQFDIPLRVLKYFEQSEFDELGIIFFISNNDNCERIGIKSAEIAVF